MAEIHRKERRERKGAQRNLASSACFVALLALTLVAFGLRAGSLTAQSLWRDEVDALCYAFEFPHLMAQAVAPGKVGELKTPCACPPPPVAIPTLRAESSPIPTLASIAGAMIRQNGPLYFFLLRGWIGLADSSEYAIRFFSLWFGVLTVPLAYGLGRRLAEREAGLAAAALMATSPYLIWYAQEAKMYTLVPALILLALYALRRGADGGKGWWWVVNVAATSLAFYTHIWSVLLVVVEAILLASWWPRWRTRWRPALVGMALLTLPYIPLALWQIPSAFVHRQTGFPSHTLGEMAVILLNGWSMGIGGVGWPWGSILCGAAAALGLLEGVLLARTQHAGRLMLLGVVGWLAAPLLGIWFVSLWQPLFTDRYLIWTAPAFYLLIGMGLALLWRKGRWPALVALAAILAIFFMNLRFQARTPIKSDLRAAAAYVEERYRPDDLLIFQIPHVRYTFDYYFSPEEYAWVDGLYTNHRRTDGGYLMTEEGVGAWMTQVVGPRRTVWLVASEVEMWDERNLVQRWLDANREREETVHFARVDVLRYRPAR